MITDWLMVIITAIYVIATILICVANFKSAKAAKEQTEEMKKQFYAINRPIISVEVIYKKRAFLGLRFVNNGAQSAHNTKIILDEEFINSLEEDFKSLLKNLKNKVCTIGVNQHYDIFIGSNKYMKLSDKKPAKGKIITTGDYGVLYSYEFEIDMVNYATFYSVNSDTEDLIKEIKDLNDILKDKLK